VSQVGNKFNPQNEPFDHRLVKKNRGKSYGKIEPRKPRDLFDSLQPEDVNLAIC
jgi:hypothetical protein